MREPVASPPPAVAIAGCGVVSAVGRGLDTLRAAMRANTSGLRACERFDGPLFQSNVVGAAPLNRDGADTEDPAHQLATEALREGCEQAREVLAAIPSPRVGLVLSTTKANIEALERMADGRPCSTAAQRHLQSDLLAADLAASHGARGPVQCVSVACVSGLVALQQGAKLIHRDAADAVLVVGVDHLSAFVVAGFTALKAIDPVGCRPFDRDRSGLSPGEAGAAIVLVRSDFAPQSAIRLLGWGSSNDANHLTGPSRDGAGLALAIRRALDSARLQPGDIDYVNAHGTGTPYNDAMESLALRAVFGEHCPPTSGAKGMLGHTLGAAGVIETILCVFALEDRWLPGTPRLRTAADGAPASLLLEPRATDRLDHVLKLNTGFGGVNGALVLGHE
ncbi:MAG: beta-ketoacyl-[acyl-carrier-protein] synthase family protein [Verrucomicrobia bacterium]|nr:beta-ketoacyl-[acyl-carrier-protein] synthase family protein [Verrucomicrobiota bacterium]